MTVIEMSPYNIAPNSQPTIVPDVPGQAVPELIQELPPFIEKSNGSEFKGLGQLALAGTDIARRLDESLAADRARHDELIASRRRLASTPQQDISEVGTDNQKTLIPAERQIVPGQRALRRLKRQTGYVSRNQPRRKITRQLPQSGGLIYH